ncbi:DUF2271 domain-containing protein [Fulvivirga sediminis]|uniref:DUF2271 domain-containing protein n=1 Tax=Fulvivirga sediminis TaxID=2803949 RepID=A0A937K0N4_9BACT|nr:DUF2271 domain-containing protein [Fulvivirga sediminis]MBL3658523.1 DUF2271 domain-containing protein [Fulvivirga sediminis]
MRNTVKILVMLLFTLALVSWSSVAIKDSYKCMVQLVNYEGEAAYIAVSLINPEGEYEETLHVMGKDERWYPDLTSWWPFFENNKEIDGTSGASIAGGERRIFVLNIDNDKLDTGYKIRFETSVEEQKYYEQDAEILLTSENVKGKFEGKGYIRYIRMIPG